jgi:hypothetical protein
METSVCGLGPQEGEKKGRQCGQPHPKRMVDVEMRFPKGDIHGIFLSLNHTKLGGASDPRFRKTPTKNYKFGREKSSIGL